MKQPKPEWLGSVKPTIKRGRIIKEDGSEINPKKVEFTGKEILKAPDGAYQIFWKDGCQRKYCSIVQGYIVFFGTQFCYDLSKGVPKEIEKIVLLMEGV